MFEQIIKYIFFLSYLKTIFVKMTLGKTFEN